MMVYSIIKFLIPVLQLYFQSTSHDNMLNYFHHDYMIHLITSVFLIIIFHTLTVTASSESIARDYPIAI